MAKKTKDNPNSDSSDLEDKEYDLSMEASDLATRKSILFRVYLICC